MTAAELHNLVPPTQSGISQLKCWQNLSKLKLSGGKTRIILISLQKFITDLSLPWSVDLDASSITLFSSVQNLNVTLHKLSSLLQHCLVGLVVKVSSSREKDRGFDSCLSMDSSEPSHTSDLKIGTPVATMTVAWQAWQYVVGSGTGWHGVSIL